jgi:hypothetical protein
MTWLVEEGAMGFYGAALQLITGVVCALFFYKAAQLEEDGPPPILWLALSVLIYMACLFFLGGSWPLMIGGQVGLLVAIGVVRVVIYLRATSKPPDLPKP